MTTFEEFKVQHLWMRQQKKEGEYVRVEIAGLEMVLILQRPRSEGAVILIVGIDANNLESVVVMPEAHFQAKLSFAKTPREKRPMGYKIDTKDCNVVTEDSAS